MGNHLSKASPDATPLISPNGKDPTKVSANGDRTECECPKILRLGSRRLCAGCGVVGCRNCIPSVIEGHGFCADKCRHKPAEYSVALTLVGAMAGKPREDRASIWGNVGDSLGTDEFVVVPTKIYSAEHVEGAVPKSYGAEKPKEYSKQQCYVEALSLHTSSKTARYWVSIALQMSWYDKVTIAHPSGETVSLGPLACYKTALCYPAERANPLTWLNLGAQMPPSLQAQDLLPDDLPAPREPLDATGCIQRAASLSEGAKKKPYYARCCETLASLLADKQSNSSGRSVYIQDAEEAGKKPCYAQCWETLASLSTDKQISSNRRWDQYIVRALKAESERCQRIFKNYQSAVSPLVPTPTPRIVTVKLWRDYRSACAALSSVFTTLVSIMAKVGAEWSLSGDYPELVDGVNHAAKELSRQKINFPEFEGDSKVKTHLVYVMLKCTFFAAMLNPANGSSFFNLETFIKHYLNRRTVPGRNRASSVGSEGVREPESPSLSPAPSPGVSPFTSMNADDTPGNIQNGHIPPAPSTGPIWGPEQDEDLTDRLRELVFLQHERWSNETRLYHEHRGEIFYNPTTKQIRDLPQEVYDTAKGCKSLLDFIVDRELPMPTVKMRLLLSLSYPEHRAIRELDEQFKLKKGKSVDGGRYGVVYEGLYTPRTRSGAPSRDEKLAVKLLPFGAVGDTALSRVYNDCSRHREVSILLNPRFENIIVRCMHVKVSPNSGIPFLKEQDREAPYVIEMYMELAKTTLAHYAKQVEREERETEGKKETPVRETLMDVKDSWFEKCDLKCKFKRLPSGLGVTMVAEFAVDLLNKLEALHSMDLVHKDIKPANILVFDEALKFADFGFSAAIQRNAFNASRTSSVNSVASDAGGMPFEVGGSPGYLSPEARYWMCSGRTDNCTDALIDLYKANDVFGLGATLLYLCTGVDPQEASVDFPSTGSDDKRTEYDKFNEDDTILKLTPFGDDIHPTLWEAIAAMTRPDYGGAKYQKFVKPGDPKPRLTRVKASDFSDLEQKIKTNILERK